MNERVTLFHLKNENITITIEAKFDGDKLIIEGYDIGKSVKDAWGDSDYEYTITIPSKGVSKLCKIFDISPCSNEKLLMELSKRYNTNSCFSEIRKLLDDNKIKYDGFSWT